MKTIIRIFIAAYLILNVNTFAQNYSSYETKPDKVIDGSELNEFHPPEIIQINNTEHIPPVYGDFFTYTIHNITDRKTGYDLQSNASTQQLWLDNNNPDFLHAVFTNSQEPITPWTDRTCLYFGSVDGGNTWIELGPVPISSRSGFPAIYGKSTGAGVITNHNAFFDATTRTSVMIDNSPYEYNFSNWDPGLIRFEPIPPIWPRHVVDNSGNVIFASAQNGPDSFFVNVFNSGTSTFSGYTGIDGEQAEQYAFAISDGGKIGLAYNGQDFPADNSGDVFYIQSTNSGLTWTDPLKIYERDHSSDTAMGAIRGVDVSFIGEQPCVVFEICTQIFSAGNYFPGLPSEILFWTPSVNGGNSFTIADSSNVPFAPSIGTNDVFVPVCRPVIGRSQTSNFIFVAFSAATDDVYPSVDSTTYFAGYLTFSSDGGNTWTTPEKFTPENPIFDWRYVSIAPINPVSGGFCTVHMVIQGDTIPGSTVNAAGMPVGVTAQYFHISTQPIAVPVELNSFVAKLVDQTVILNWSTSTETNNLGFEINRKIIREEEGEWITIGFREGSGTTTEPQTYTYNDNIEDINAGSFIYKLKQIDYDGSFEFSEEITVENILAQPKVFSLSQNYPNPFNPSTKISWQSPVGSWQTLKIYDVLGNEVATLIDEYKPAGIYDIEWNATGLPSGIYFYQLKAEGFVKTKKIMLLK